MTTTAEDGPHYGRHRPTGVHGWLFTGFKAGNGFAIAEWVNSNGGEAHGDGDRLYIKNRRRQGRNWVEPGDRVGRRLRLDGTPTDDFYRLEPDVWAEAYDDLGPVAS